MILEINAKITVYKFRFKNDFDNEFYFLFEHLTNTNRGKRLKLAGLDLVTSGLYTFPTVLFA